MKLLVTIIVAAAILTPTMSASDTRALCPALLDFVDAIFKTANFENDLASREKKYKSAVNQITSVAKSHFGPLWDPDDFKRDVIAFVQHQELYRKPPVGWEPKSSMENMLLFSDIARSGLAIDLKLLRWCDKRPMSR